MANRTANEIAKLFVENRIDSFTFMLEPTLFAKPFYRTQILLSNKQGVWITDVWSKEHREYPNSPFADGSFEVNGTTYNYSVEIAGYYKAGKQNSYPYKMTITYKVPDNDALGGFIDYLSSIYA